MDETRSDKEFTSSALVLVFASHSNANEPMTTLAIDTDAFAAAPIGESVRIDIDTLNHFPLRLDFALSLLRSLEPLFPGAGHLVGVFEDRQQGRVIFLPKPNEANSADHGVDIGCFGHRHLPISGSEITEEMIDAGAAVIWRGGFDFECYDSPTGAKILAERVIAAALKARHESCAVPSIER